MRPDPVRLDFMCGAPPHERSPRGAFSRRLDVSSAWVHQKRRPADVRPRSGHRDVPHRDGTPSRSLQVPRLEPQAARLTPVASRGRDGTKNALWVAVKTLHTENRCEASGNRPDLASFTKLLSGTRMVADRCRNHIASERPVRETLELLVAQLTSIRGRFRVLSPLDQDATWVEVVALEQEVQRLRQLLRLAISPAAA